ncbi:MAG TPA: ABC transporter permease [Solirubrobacteraceae bacterium]|nr:ABC transporter permease [Solirubrobacteraceae bacterium]
MRPYALLYFYRRRLRVHAVQELLAGVGIAIAVALVFAATVAQRSIAGSAGEVVHAVVGPASLQLRARGGNGFSEQMLARVEKIAGVKQAAPLLEQTATVLAPGGRRETVEVAGTDVSLAILNGLAHTLPIASLTRGAIGLSSASAQALGISRSQLPASGVTLELRGRRYRLRVAAVLGAEAAGALSRSLVAVMPLKSLQQLAGLEGRVTRILVQTEPGRRAVVRAELQRLAGARLNVAAADQDVEALHQALGPSALASGLFAAIGALLGFLFAFNAMLLTVPERRQAIADLRLAGTRRSALVQMVLFQALCLGLAASLVGLGLGYVLSVGVFHQSSAYLAEAFTLGGGTIVGAWPVLLALAGGVLVTCLASAVPLLDLRRGRPRDAVLHEAGVPGNALGAAARRQLMAAAVGMLVIATVMFAWIPAAAVAATAALALATVFAVPLVFAGVLRVSSSICGRYQRLTTLPVAVASLQATTLRSLALAATGAVALFGSVALGGSRENLLRGIGGFAHSYVSDAEIWVANPGDNQATNDFRPGDTQARIAALPAVASVRAFQGGFLQLGSRRVWIVARPPGGSDHVLMSQTLDGNAREAARRLGSGGWIVVSKRIAEEHHVGVGGTLSLPTPSGQIRMRIAATTTNLAWPPGVIFMSSADYARAWDTNAPTAFGVNLRPGASAVVARGAIEHALGDSSGLEVSLAHARERRIDALTREGLGQLGEISTLLLLAAVTAMAAALASSVWQRRSWLAGLRLSGAKPGRLRRILLAEAALMLGAGCMTGAVAGIYGQVGIDGYLRYVTGFPLASSLTGLRPLEVFAVVLAAALAIVAVPGWFASRVSPMLALDSE